MNGKHYDIAGSNDLYDWNFQFVEHYSTIVNFSLNFLYQRDPSMYQT